MGGASWLIGRAMGGDSGRLMGGVGGWDYLEG